MKSKRKRRSGGKVIVRWHGWCAKCPDCRKIIDLAGDGALAWERKKHVEDGLKAVVSRLTTLAGNAREACGCRKEKEKKP